MEKCNISALIPAYNAEKTIKLVIGELKSISEVANIIVVNDGSSDNTKNIVTNLETFYLEHEGNLGKGAALKTGFKKALELNTNVIVTLDADCQHKPKELIKLIDELLKRKLDLVIGSRLSNTKEMPFHRLVSNRVTSKLISWRVGLDISDSQSGFRAIRTKVLKNINLQSNRYELESELLIKAALFGFKIGFTNIKTIYPKNQPSSIKFTDILRFVLVYIKSFTW